MKCMRPVAINNTGTTFLSRTTLVHVCIWFRYKTALNDPTTQATFAGIAAKIVRSLKEGADEASNVHEWSSKIAQANLQATIAEEGEEEEEEEAEEEENDMEVSDGEEDVEAAAVTEAAAQQDEAVASEQEDEGDDSVDTSSSDSENSDEEFEEEVVPAREQQKKKKGRSGSSRSNKVTQPSSDENSHPNNARARGRRVRSSQ